MGGEICSLFERSFHSINSSGTGTTLTNSTLLKSDKNHNPKGNTFLHCT